MNFMKTNLEIKNKIFIFIYKINNFYKVSKLFIYISNIFLNYRVIYFRSILYIKLNQKEKNFKLIN